jgi:hypothetical protein
VDARRHALWACSTAVPEMNGYRADDKGRSGLFKLDVASGKLLQKSALEEPGVEHNRTGSARIASCGSRSARTARRCRARRSWR